MYLNHSKTLHVFLYFTPYSICYMYYTLQVDWSKPDTIKFPNYAKVNAPLLYLKCIITPSFLYYNAYLIPPPVLYCVLNPLLYYKMRISYIILYYNVYEIPSYTLKCVSKPHSGQGQRGYPDSWGLPVHPHLLE
jgi:hypothetical protein